MCDVKVCNKNKTEKKKTVLKMMFPLSKFRPQRKANFHVVQGKCENQYNKF